MKYTCIRVTQYIYRSRTTLIFFLQNLILVVSCHMRSSVNRIMAVIKSAAYIVM